jgi:hypothetical protein
MSHSTHCHHPGSKITHFMHSYIHSVGSLMNATRDSVHYTYTSNAVHSADTTQISNTDSIINVTFQEYVIKARSIF